MSTRKLRFVSLFLAVIVSAQAQQRLSNDPDLKELDLSGWDCLDKPGGSAKTPDGVERNQGKNRSAIDLKGLTIPDLDTAGFHKLIDPFDQAMKGRRRKDVFGPQRAQMEELEKRVVSLTGYLVYAYAGPPETTNCASVDFHDWHMEVFDKPSDHPPRPGDPTPIVCEITPRTQNDIYKSGIRLRDLSAFIRLPDLSYEATGHPAKKVRLTGYLLWDDEHNGSADVGTNIQTAAERRFHNPWRSTGWEIHPVLKIEALDGAASAAPATNAAAIPAATSAATAATTPVEAVATATPLQIAPVAQIAIVLEPLKVKIPYGETVLPLVTKLQVGSRDAHTVTVRYMETTVRLPLQSVEIR
ncbi:MAG: hypothetical protein ACXWAV_01000 [Chthoniobacterales bacterium]